MKGDLIYLASPYAKYPHGKEKAFEDICVTAAELISVGYKIYSPIAHTHPIALHGKLDAINHEFWLKFDETMMGVCDSVVVAKMESWEISYGVGEEIKIFTKAGKPVYYLDPISMKIEGKAK